MSLLGGLFALQPEFRPPAALELIERERLTALYLAPTLFHDLVLAAPDAGADVSSVRKLGYAGAPMTAVLVERVRRAVRSRDVFVNHYGSTEIYTFTIHGDQRAEAGLRRPRRAERAHPPRAAPTPTRRPTTSWRPARSGRSICHLSSDEAFAGYWHRPGRRRAADPRRLVLPRRPRARSTRTATCSSSAAPTT